MHVALQAFPPPPAYYKAHGPDAEPGHPLLLPPPPIEGEYQFMGELYTVQTLALLSIPANCSWLSSKL